MDKTVRKVAMVARGIKWSDMDNHALAHLQQTHKSLMAIAAATSWDEVTTIIDDAAPRLSKRNNKDMLYYCDKSLVRVAVEQTWELEYLQWVEPRESQLNFVPKWA